MLTVHHLGLSQSERILWLCEELNLPYTLVKHTRNPVTRFAPDSLKSIPGNALESAPIIQDEDVTLAESGAVVEYLIHKHGGGNLALPPSHADYADYIYWFHLANGALMPAIMAQLFLRMSGLPSENPTRGVCQMRLDRLLRHYEDRLSKMPYLAGEKFTAADIMTVYCLTTNRYFENFSLKGYEGILAWLERCGGRDGYVRAMGKGDPDVVPALGAELPGKSLL